MTCVSGFGHTVCLSEDGTIYGLGRNCNGQLGLSDSEPERTLTESESKVVIPTPIRNLPKIVAISCGFSFTACLDEEGTIWSFGENNFGQLGTGDTKARHVPHQISNAPPFQSISCGGYHIITVTKEQELWSLGKNQHGQLALQNKEDQSFPQKTSYNNISNISTGFHYTLFQNSKGEIYGCGLNEFGQLGLGYCDKPPHNNPFGVNLIPNQPPNVIQFCSGSDHSLFLDTQGNVYGVGYNYNYNLGLGHNTPQFELILIPNIPPIRRIACVGSSSFIIDVDGNLWSFGGNENGQLGHGDSVHKTVPTMVENLTDIVQTSCGCSGGHFLCQDSQNTIYGMGRNNCGQIGSDEIHREVKKPSKFSEKILAPSEWNKEYFSVWKAPLFSRAKSARK